MHAVPLPTQNVIDSTATQPVRDLRRVPIHPDFWYPWPGRAN